MRSRLRGILAMLAAVAVFSVMDASMKQLAVAYPPLQVSCLRGLASIPFLLLGVAWLGRWRELRPRRWRQHVLRGALAIAMLWLFVYSVTVLPLTEAYAIFLSAPLMVTALSVLLLREHVGWHRWLAVVIGLLGVIVMLRPGASRLVTQGVVAAFGSALAYALAVLMIRQLTRTESTLSIAFSFVVVIAIVAGIAALPGWVPLQWSHWPWILALGIAGAVGQIMIIEAFRLAPAAVIAPFEYTALLWALAWDWIFWSTSPSARTLLGGALITASGLYVIYREQRVGAQIEGPLANPPP